MADTILEPLKNVPHPFYPLDAEVVGYLANEYSVPVLLGTFAAGCIVLLGATSALIGRSSPTLSRGDKAAVLWNVLSKSRSMRAAVGTDGIQLARYISSSKVRILVEQLCHTER